MSDVLNVQVFRRVEENFFRWLIKNGIYAIHKNVYHKNQAQLFIHSIVHIRIGVSHQYDKHFDPSKKHKRISAIYIGYKSTQLIMRSITWARFRAFLLLFRVPIVFCILEFVKYYYCKMHFKLIRFIFVDITEMYNTQSIEIGFILLLFWSILFQLDNEKRIHTS